MWPVLAALALWGLQGCGGDLVSEPCLDPPCAASLLGDVGKTIVAGSGSGLASADRPAGTAIPAGENIYGPFEAGFTATNDDILAALGCATGRGYADGGIDTRTAEQVVAADCGVTLPRTEGGTYVSLLDECGGHTPEYHFHERLSCLYELAGGHSTAVGRGMDDKLLYGEWEDWEKREKPELDACGGHFGPTPEEEEGYHYHVQARPPFTFGCFGPTKSGELMSVDACRSLYPPNAKSGKGCGDGSVTLQTPGGAVEYDLWCPCFDEDGSNVRGQPLV